MTKQEFEDKYITELTFDLPIEIGQLKLYPILLKDFYKFMMCASVLQIKKDRIPDAKIISMSYMEYLASIMITEKDKKQEEQIVTNSFFILLSLSLRSEDISLKIIRNKLGKLCFVVNDFELKSNTFNEMKDVILFQNVIGYTGIELNEEMEKELEEANRIRNYGSKNCSLEKQILSMLVGTSCTLNSVYEMTIRKFYALQEMKDKELHYKIIQSASLSGMVKMKEKITHYLMEKDDNSLEDALADYDTFKSKF